jgi:Zn-dependent protease with chaperone function
VSYVDKILQPGERILVRGGLHWIIYVPALIFLLASVFSFFFAVGRTEGVHIGWQILGVCFVVVSAMLGISAWFSNWITEIAVTNQRAIYKRGFIWRRTAEMNMDKV